MSQIERISESREGDTRCRIVAAAEKLFRDIGYQKTTVSDIARALAMSPANVYRFFTSKKEINETVALRLIGEVEAAVAAIASGPGAAPVRLRAMFTTVCAMNEERFVSDVKIHEMVSAALTESRQIVHDHIMRMTQMTAKVLQEGMASGDFRHCDPAVIAPCLHVATMRYCHPRLMVECADTPEPTLERLLDFVFMALEPKQ